jgi:thioredoxin-related protein
MKKLTIFFLVLSIGLSVFASGKEWMTDLDKGLKLSAKNGKPVLLYIAGSTWCKWCIVLDKEVFSKKEFKDYAKNNLILVMLDFPLEMGKEQEQKAMILNKKFGFQGAFPTILLIDNKGKVLVETGYFPGGVLKYIAFLKSKIPVKKAVKAKK